MAVIIKNVISDSYAEKAGLISGDKLLSINGNDINDILDYRFFLTDKKLKLKYESNGKIKKARIKKSEYDDIGLEFDTYLMDKQHSCRNKCIFCFIDQMPPGMRESLYFKDDDERLSFLFGNYVTLTNLTDHDVERIIRMHISPVNISVHTTDPKLRCMMMNNRFAGESLKYLYQLAEAGIEINCQLVLCPGINDGDELKRTLCDLGELYPSVSSIACVPVGLTDYRDGLFELKPYDKETASQTVNIINEFADEFYKNHGERLAYASDEFYLTAQMELEKDEFYGDYKQLENGVGMMTLMKTEFMRALESEEYDEPAESVSLATGVAASPFIKSLIDEAGKKWHNLKCEVYPIVNDFFGHKITVAGLVTGTDIIKQLKGKPLGKKLIIPKVMLRYDSPVFLDDVTVAQVEEQLGVKIVTVSNDGYDFLRAIIKGE